MGRQGSAIASNTRVNIRPGVNILSVLQHLNYKPWFALAEFVDNSLQSALSHREELEATDGRDYTLQVQIEPDFTSVPRLIIRDNAAGIFSDEYARAFRPAELPPDRSGLSEFGMGMKSAACWFAPRWSVRTTSLGESVERTISFDLAKIVEDNLEELDVVERQVSSASHYTEVILEGLYRPPQKRTVGKIKDHLASIFRQFLREGSLELTYDRSPLIYEEPDVLNAPYFKDSGGNPVEWRKEIDLDFGLGWRARGFAALRQTGSTSTAGFALFRRKRLIQGSADEAYRPEFVFSKSNSYTYQRLFGELSLDGFEVSHTKDGFRWDDYEDIFLDELKKALDAEPLPLLRQAEGHRSRPRRQDIQKGADLATRNTAETVEREAQPVITEQAAEVPDPEPPDEEFEPSDSITNRKFHIPFDDCDWEVELELVNDASIGDWMSLYDLPGNAAANAGGIRGRNLGIRMNVGHPYTERFAGTDSLQLEAMLRMAVAIGLAETTSRDAGVKYAGEIRDRVNRLLRDVLSKPA